jgi:Cytochrome c554 and c-prime
VNKPRLARPVVLFERHWPWAILGGSIALVLTLMTLIFATGFMASINDLRFGPNVRGYTATGILMGLLSLFFVILTMWYSARKRRNVAGATMMTWLWAHVYFGLLAVVAAVLHAGFGLMSASFTSGKLLFLLFSVIAGSGIFWRLAYVTVPPKAAVQTLNYSKEGALKRAEEQTLEIEKLTAGKSQELQRIKDALLARDVPMHELNQMVSTLGPEDRALMDDIVQFAASRRRALARPEAQQAFTKRMQFWRIIHVPLAFLFLFALVFHVFGAFDFVRKTVPSGIADDGAFAVYKPSIECKDCHKAIYAQWAESMHAHALTSPLTVVQNNLDMRHSLLGAATPDPRRMCINCHGPAVAATTDGDLLPLKSGRALDGIDCVACHQMNDAVVPGGGASAKSYQDQLVRGERYFARLDGPVGNSYHRSNKSPLFDAPEKLCATCHNVNADRNNDGKIVKGVDLVLQTTFDEYREYQRGGGTGNCVTCHMPVVPGLKQAADGASAPFTVDYPPPDRQVHDHGFVGVDYPLDTVAKRDPQKPKRAALLASAATFTVDTVKVDAQNLNVKFAIQNQTGHNLPTGFAFARQMWIELVVKDGASTIFTSGLLAKGDDDLCDNGTFGEASNPLRSSVIGCTQVDQQLVNIQLKLVDKIAALADAAGQPAKDEGGDNILIQSSGGSETYIQFFTGGGVARQRPSDKTNMGPLRPLQRKTYGYVVPLPKQVRNGTFTARLLFRNLPPYWIRAMGREQKPGTTDGPQLGPLVPNLQTVEMAKVAGSFTR